MTTTEVAIERGRLVKLALGSGAVKVGLYRGVVACDARPERRFVAVEARGGAGLWFLADRQSHPVVEPLPINEEAPRPEVHAVDAITGIDARAGDRILLMLRNEITYSGCCGGAVMNPLARGRAGVTVVFERAWPLVYWIDLAAVRAIRVTIRGDWPDVAVGALRPADD